MEDYNRILEIYNPWWHKGVVESFRSVPGFRRSIFAELYRSISELPQMISLTGPRRVGKSTLLKQIIRQLIESGVDPKSIIYYSFDDPALLSDRINKEEFINSLFTYSDKKGDITWLFLDEIQSFENWELYLKKYYDLGFPLKIVVSGSATSPIFKKSRESLLGRLKDFHLLSFSFYEYLLYFLDNQRTLCEEVKQLHAEGSRILAFEHPHSVENVKTEVSAPLMEKLDEMLSQYLLDGGFPEVWSLPDAQAKQDYLYDNQVKKVIYEDLVLAADFRKPEMLKRFYLSLLENPGKEISLNSFANETEINLQMIQKYLPLLEMTDLVYSLPKFRPQVLRIRKGLAKYYISDLALRNAVMRLSDSLLQNSEMLGLYAENLVYLTLRRNKSVLQVDYYRERDYEVDFILHTTSGFNIPVEVKYRNKIEKKFLNGIDHFREKNNKTENGVVITKKWSDNGDLFGYKAIPLPLYLIFAG